MKTKVVNFFAGPSAGKTTNALGLAAKLKQMRKDVLYIPEFAMYEVVRENENSLNDQLYIFGQQANLFYHAKDRYEWVVTDGPLPLMFYYMEDANKKFPEDKRDDWLTLMGAMIISTFNMYDNYNYFVDRGNREFRQLGRVHDLEQSKRIDRSILEILEEFGLPFTTITDTEQVIADLSEKGIM